MESTSTSTSGLQAASTGPKPLSCVSCRQRKVKCNKVHPCLPCQKAGFQCVFPNRVRVPRNKPVGQARDSELLRRISRLESLVSKVDAAKALVDRGQDLGSLAITASAVDPLRPAQEETTPPCTTDQYATFVKASGSKYLSGEFWISLGNEVDGLRQLLEHPSDDDDDEVDDSSTSTKPSTPNFVFKEPTTPSAAEIFSPTPQHRIFLVQRYFSNVNPICKLLHQPTVTAHLLGATSIIDTASNRFKFTSIEAVSSAMYFAAITSMSAEDCARELGEDRDSLLILYKHSTEMALAQADFLNSMEIVTLEAFVIYLMALPCHSRDRSSWALIGLAVRIAHSLGLHKDGDGRGYTFFQAEMRRRLWWQIIVLDTRGSEDRGSEPLITDGSFNTRIPYNLNDADFGYETPSTIAENDTMTEMAFCLMSMDVSDTMRRLNFIPLTQDKKVPSIDEKIEIAKKCCNRIENFYLKGCDPSIPHMWVVSNVGRLLVLKVWSVLQYPLQRRESRPRVDDQGQSLRTAISILETAQLLDVSPQASGFRWFFATYVPWHPLAVALAELCTNNHGPLADQAWAVIEQGYQKWSDRVADTKQGMLWKPVKKLYQRAKAAKERALSLSSLPIISSEVLSNLPNLSLQPSSLTNYVEVNNYPASNMITSPNLGLDWLPMAEMPNFQGVETLGGPINWDDWNQFIFDTATLDAQVQPDLYEQWSLSI